MAVPRGAALSLADVRTSRYFLEELVTAFNWSGLSDDRMDIIAAHRQGLIEQLDDEVAALAGRGRDHAQRAVVLHHLYDHGAAAMSGRWPSAAGAAGCQRNGGAAPAPRTAGGSEVARRRKPRSRN